MVVQVPAPFDTRFRRGIALASIDHYSKRFKYILAKRACEILSALQCGHDTFVWFDYQDNGDIWTPKTVLECRDARQWCAAHIAPITFIGGPPNVVRKFEGSLLTMLCDRIAVSVLTEGMKALDNIIAADERYS